MMYSLSQTSFRYIRRCPLTQSTVFHSYTCRHFFNNSTKLTSTLEANHDSKRNYVSLGPRRHADFNMTKLQADIVNQSKKVLQEVQFINLKEAPTAAFWYGIGGLAPIVLPPLSFLLFGYSHWMASAQLAFGATACTFFGGARWGHIVQEKSGVPITWESLGWAVGPSLIAWLGLITPATLGFLLVSTGMYASTLVDLTTMNFPPWYRALRLAVTTAAIAALILSALMSLFH